MGAPTCSIEHLIQTVRDHGTVGAAARALGMHTATVASRLRRHGVQLGKMGGTCVPFSNEARAKALIMRSQGEPIWRISGRTGASHTTIFEWFRKADVATRKPHSQETRARAVELYLEGHAAHAVAETIGASERSVLSWVRAAGHNARPRSPARMKVDIDRVKELRARFSVKDTAEILGISTKTLRRVLREASNG